MVANTPNIKGQERDAILLMFGPVWQRKFRALDGQEGRPSIADCIDKALMKPNGKAQEDLVSYLEKYLADTALALGKKQQALYQTEEQ